MAEFITREEIVCHIDRIIRQAEKEIVLISPFINADDETKSLIAKTTRQVTIDVIYGKRELRPKERGFFDERSVKLSYSRESSRKMLSERERGDSDLYEPI